MSTPIMSTNAVSMSTRSSRGTFPNAATTSATIAMPTAAFVTGDISRGARSLGLSERGGRHCPTDDPRERDDGERVGDHLHELRRDRLRPLELDLERLGGG